MTSCRQPSTKMDARSLWAYLDKLNEKNDFDLAWKWEGDEDVPYIKVYEEAERHELCGGTMHNIKERIQNALPGWGLEDVDE
jgi:hypothetical protein